MSADQTVALVTLGCARNEVDSEELAGRLNAAGWTIVDNPAEATAVLVNTCGFVDVAKKDSIDAVLAAADLKDIAGGPQAVVAVGCLSERYGNELADSLPEADAVLGFDDYPQIADRLRDIVAGDRPVAHAPRDRRQLLPLTPVDRDASAVSVPGHADVADVEDVPGWTPPVLRTRLDGSPVAPVKLASGCDRRCAFCAIPSFRGSFVSRQPADVLAEIIWLAGEGVKEIVLVSENSTSYGKDLGDLRLLETFLTSLDAVQGLERIRVAYLQPAEVRPGLLSAMAQTPIIAPYFDLSFQHSSPTVLRRMRRFGGTEDFLALIERIRELDPEAGIRSNVIVGFPGETQEEFDELVDFLERAGLDAIGVFGYSDEEGTEAATLPDKVAEDVIRERVERISSLSDELMLQRAEERMGSRVRVIVEGLDIDEDDEPIALGRAGHQGPDDAGTIILLGDEIVEIGDVVECIVIATDGVDLVAEPA